MCPPLPHRPGHRAAAEALARAAPLASRWIERLLATHDPPLTVAQYLVLQAVEDGEIVGAELARRSAVSPAAVSQLVAALESAGLLGRAGAQGDRRRQPLALTRRGEQVLRSARALLASRLAAVLAELPAPEADALARLLVRLEGLLGAAPPPRRRPPGPPPPRPR
jgi:DNA-binding MarR family transcriptional regulator